MIRPHARRRPTSRFHVPRRTLRLRLALFYGGLFLVSGIVLLVVTVGLWQGATSGNVTVHPQSIVASASPRSSIDHATIAGQQHGSDLRQLLIYSGVALLIAGLLAIPLGWLAAGRILRPLRTIMATAGGISANSLQQRVSLEGPDDEFKELGEALDDLLARLESSFESQRHFVANASHELRTPLTVERTVLQVALGDPQAGAETLRSTCEKLLALGYEQERLIEALLTLASSERGIERWEDLDLAELAARAVLARSEETVRRGILVEEVLGAAPARGDPSLVESLIANLVENAVRHNVDGGQVHVTTETRAGMGIVAVTNTGPVVPPDDVERLFEPFRRGGTERTRNDGHGLGLPIVRAVAAAHGATVAVHPQPQGGLHVEVSFPTGSPAG